jgi:anhydro-N-acetylmuramic acid kinase
MNPYLKRLFEIAEAPKRRILGLMSGTSLDGLDMALCEFRGSGLNTEYTLKKFNTYAYSDDFRNQVLKVYSKGVVHLQDVCLLNEWIGLEQGKIINHQIHEWGMVPSEIDILASHGQTIYHAPYSLHKNSKFPNGTFQIGDGDHIAQTTQIITLSDFRQKQIAAGGEGAPLAPYGDFLLFSSASRERILINIGGISNFTYLPVKNSGKDFQSSDLGPGNTLMDRFVQTHFPGYTFDKDGEISDKGRIIPSLLEKFFQDPFFGYPIPKSTGPERFNLPWLESILKTLPNSPSPENIMATLNELSAESIYRGIKEFLTDDTEIYFSGGGVHNRSLMEKLKAKLFPSPCMGTEVLGLDPDAKEAVLFALLANECIAGKSKSFSHDGPLYPQVSMGKISLPN